MSLVKRGASIVGMTFGRLIVLSVSENNKNKVICQCSCPNKTIKEIFKYCLISGHTKSCGCLVKEAVSKTAKTHGMSNTKEYRTFKSILTRCFNPNCKEYKHYGAKGITICERWKNSFENFLADMGKCPPDKTSLDRIDNNGNYEPGNCRWSTAEEQNRNKSNSIKIPYDGKKLSMLEWSKITGLNISTIRNRYIRGYSEDQILSPEITRPASLYSSIIENPNQEQLILIKQCEEIFWSLVNKTDNCWEFIGQINKGYGKFYVPYIEKYIGAHRYSWEINSGKIPEGLLVCHKCNNKKCVRPDHLYVGSDKSNAEDVIKSNGKKDAKGSKNPAAKLTEEIVLECKKRVANGETYTNLAKEFGVNGVSISNAVRGISWKHLNG